MYDTDKWLKHIAEGISEGPYTEDWGSLSKHPTPKWFRDGKFGIFIHWGVYSVPAFGNEWYPRNMYIQGSKEYEHHIKTYGPHKKFGYKDFIPMFKGEKFDPAAWVELFKEAGAKYVVPVAEHHDGFQMYRSELSDWNAAEMGPHRDIVGELTEEMKKQGIINCASTHRIEHWFFFGYGRDFDSDVPANAQKKGDLYWPALHVNQEDLQNRRAEPYPTEEFLTDWMIRTIEIIDRFHPHQIYFDWMTQHETARPYLKKIAAYYYNQAAKWGEEVMIISKCDSYPYGVSTVDLERGAFATAQPFPWQTDTAIAKNSWGYTENNDFKKPNVIIYDFVDAIAKNGSMLLNVGPKPDGTFTEEDTAVLKAIGRWMKANSDAIYGSRPWRIQSEGPTKAKEGAFADAKDTAYTPEDFRFTINNGKLYVFAMNWPESGTVTVKSLKQHRGASQSDFNEPIENVRVLGYDGVRVETEDTDEGMRIHADGIKTEYPVVFEFTFR